MGRLTLWVGMTYKHQPEADFGDRQVRRMCPGGLRNVLEPLKLEVGGLCRGRVGEGRRWSKKGLGIRAIGAGDLSGSQSFLHGTGESYTGSFGGLVPCRAWPWSHCCAWAGPAAHCTLQGTWATVVSTRAGGREETVHLSVPGMSHSGA